MRENNKIPLEGEHTANVYAYNVRISTKNSVEVCNFIRNKNLTKAKTQLQKVLKFKQVIPLKRYKKDQPHRPGKIAAGSFPIKTTKEFLNILNTLEANASQKNLDTKNLVIFHALANKGPQNWHTGRHRRRRVKSTHIELKVKENKND